MAAATPASMYAAQAPTMAADRLRTAAQMPYVPGGFGDGADTQNAGFGMTAPLASLMTLQHQLGVAPAGSTTLNIHPTNGVTVKTTPAKIGIPDMPSQVGLGGTKPVHPASKPKPKAAPNLGNEIASGDLIDAYNQEAKGIPGQVASIYAPIANSLAALYQNRSAQLQNAINSYTPIYGQMLGQYAPESQANYQQASESQAAIDNMLQAALGGQGAAASAALANQIASTGVAPDVAGRMEGLNAARYQGEQGAAAARGAASLSQLLGQGVNAANYGDQLPGIAGAAGLLATRQGQAGITNDELSSLNQLAQNEGSTSGQLYSDLRQALNNMGMLQLYYGPRGTAAVTTAGANVTKAGAAKTNAAANTTRANAYAGPYAGAATTKANAAATNAAAATTRAGAAVTNAKANTTRAAAYAAGKNAPKQPSSKQVADFWQTAYHGVSPRYYQGQPVAGTGQPPLRYGAAIQQAVALGQTQAQATRVANSLYKPGEGGRPLFTPKQQRANQIAFGQTPFQRLISGGK